MNEEEERAFPAIESFLSTSFPQKKKKSSKNIKNWTEFHKRAFLTFESFMGTFEKIQKSFKSKKIPLKFSKLILHP